MTGMDDGPRQRTVQRRVTVQGNREHIPQKHHCFRVTLGLQAQRQPARPRQTQPLGFIYDS